MKYNTLADICSKNPNARMTIGYYSFPVKIRNISCDSSNPYDSTTILTVENSGDPYAPLFKKYGDTNAKCIKRVIFNNPATIVFWSDGTKTVVKCDERDKYDPEKGLAMAIAKKSMGNNYKYYGVFEKFLPRDKTCVAVESVEHGYNPIQKAYEILTESARDLTSFDIYEVIGYLGEALAE